MRNKDFKSIAEKKSGYRLFFSKEQKRQERLFRTPRGWFLLFYIPTQNGEGKMIYNRVIGEVSVITAQQWLDKHHINFSTGW